MNFCRCSVVYRSNMIEHIRVTDSTNNYIGHFLYYIEKRKFGGYSCNFTIDNALFIIKDVIRQLQLVLNIFGNQPGLRISEVWSILEE